MGSTISEYKAAVAAMVDEERAEKKVMTEDLQTFFRIASGL